MTRTEAQKQANAYRNAAAEYAANGNAFAAQQLKELAFRIESKLRA